VEALQEALDYASAQQLNVLILSGGSNILLPEYVHALIIHMDIQGIEVLAETDSHVSVHVGAGQNWHEFVLYSTAHHWFGLQNLALIPGLVGACPVQNIGAYGVEVGEFIEQVHVYDRELQQLTQLAAEQCHFSYRHSIFKEHPNRYVIVGVTFKLRKTQIYSWHMVIYVRQLARNKPQKICKNRSLPFVKASYPILQNFQMSEAFLKIRSFHKRNISNLLSYTLTCLIIRKKMGQSKLQQAG